jgi:hypothetical protein
MSKHITHLSFSRAKELNHSPLALKRYLLKQRVATKAMDEGTLLDVLLFTPEKLDEIFYVMPDDVKKPTSVKLNAAKPSDATLAQIARWNEVESEIDGRIVITPQQKADAEFLRDAVENNSTVVFHGLLRRDAFTFQPAIEFYYKGFLHRGFADAMGKTRDGVNCIWDLKRMGSRSGESLVRSQIRANMYDLQAAIYCHPYDSEGIPCKYYIIAVDNEGFVTPFEISRDARDRARFMWDRLIRAAHRCNMEGLDAGTEFWADHNGFFNY